MEQGRVVFEGGIEESVGYYSNISLKEIEKESLHKSFSNKIIVESFQVYNSERVFQKGSTLALGDCLKININILINEDIYDMSIAMDLLNHHLELISHITNEDDGMYFPVLLKGQKISITIHTKEILFVPGLYNLNLWIGTSQINSLYSIKNLTNFIIEQSDLTKRTKPIPTHSKVYLHSNWKLS